MPHSEVISDLNVSFFVYMIPDGLFDDVAIFVVCILLCSGCAACTSFHRSSSPLSAHFIFVRPCALFGGTLGVRLC